MMDITLAKTISTIDTVIRHPGMSFDQNYHFTKWYYAGSRGIQDENVIGDWSSDYNVNDYSDVFIDWIKDYSYNTVTGIDNFIPTFSNGTTQAFDSFYMAHHSKRFRIFPEEYYYHYVQLDNCMDYAERTGQYSKYNIQSSRYNLGILYQNDGWISRLLI